MDILLQGLVDLLSPMYASHKYGCGDLTETQVIVQGAGVLAMFLMCGADDVRKSYMGCFSENDGSYIVPPWGGGHTLPACLNTNGFTLEHCALAAAQAGYEVYSIQDSGYCCMGTITDVLQMKTKYEESRCTTIPCYNGVGCIVRVHKVYVVGASWRSWGC
jgi:hypothetical protein